MDGRGRSGTNSSSTSSVPIMSSYYGPGTPGDAGSGNYSARECFWSQPGAVGPTATPVDPWNVNSYGQPLLPSQSPSYNNNSPPNSNTGSFNIPSSAPYPPRIPPVNGMNGNGSSHGELSPFPGPSPPNPMQPQPVPYGAPPPSSRQYTPSTTPSPHVQQSPSNVNGVNGNSLSSHSSHENSPPNSGNNNTTFDLGYMNGSSGVDMNSTKSNGPSELYPPPQMPYYQSYPNQYDSQNMAPSYYDSFSQNQQRRPFDPYQPYPHANPGYGESGAYGPNEEYNSGMRTSQDGTQGESNGRRCDSISGLEMVVENGTKVDSCDSMHSQRKPSIGGSSTPGHGLRSSFDEDPSFDSVLHGHNSFGSHNDSFRPDHDSNSNNFQSPSAPPSYSNLDAPADENPKNKSPSQNEDSGKANSTRRREKRRKNRSDASTSAQNNNSDNDRSRKKKNKDKSFLGSGNPQSPSNSNSNSSQSSSSNQSRKQQSKSEGESNSQPFSEGGGDRSPTNSNDNNDSTGKASSENSSSNIPNTATSKSSSRKKPWKKAKQVNSEQLLEERERNCAEYIENSQKMRTASTSSDSSSKKVKEEPIIHLPPISSCPREEKNITIDHQKEEMYKHRDSFEGDDDDSSTVSKRDKKDVPLVECGCFPIDEIHPEPGPFYTHLGAAHTLPELRELLEVKTGFRGAQLRFEKVIYTGKEGKTSQGCPLAKWIIRRGSYEEQLLFLVKHRKGHKCATAWIVVCCVIWEAVPPHFADNLYDTVVYKLNRFGVPTTRRSDTNEQRSCACNGVDPDTCGAAYSFGCAWSMFFNGCKYARSRNVRKFRLTEEHEEAELEEKIQHLATHLGPLYERVASDSYRNQIEHENEGLECRLGYRPGRPFSGVTACLDYCSHAHKDAHNMINGCTVTVAFTRNRTLSKTDDEQFHVLPLYKLDESDEYGSKEGQKQKIKKGQLEVLKKFPTKVRVRKVPLLPSRRRGKPNKPASSSGSTNSSSHSSHHNHSTKSGDSYSSDLPSLSMPPPLKREKMSIFEELNGPAGGSDLFDSRFPHGPAPPSHFSNLLLSKSHSKLGMGMGLPMSHEEHVQSCQISSTVLDSEGCPQTIWNSPYGQLPQSGHSHAQQGSSFRSYFDTPHPPTSQYSSKSPSQYGSFDFHLSSTPRSGGNTTTNHNNSSTSLNVNHSNVSNNMQSAPSAMPTPSYSSMSPSILPSFRHTFMTEAESLSMLSSMTSPSAGSPNVDSTSSPRSGKSSQQLNLPTPVSSAPITPFSHHSDNLGLGGAPSYFNPTAPIVPPNPYANSSSSSLYHPHPHHPTPSSCLPSAPNQVGVPFNSSTSYANSSSSFGPPPPSMDPHHSFGMGMNMNPIPAWNPSTPTYSHHGYGSVPPPAPAPSSYHHPHNQMSSLGMNSMTPSTFPHMSQYNPYGNQFMSSHSALHSHHPPNPWVSPIPSFISGAHPHQPPSAPSCFVTPPKPKVIPEVSETTSDNEDAFKDLHLGGVGIALTHGSVILQCAKHEMHATTSLKSPNRMYPSRICLVFYQHKSMNNRFHGWSEWEKKIEAKKLQEVKLINQGKLEASPRKMKQLIKEGYIADNQ